MTVVARAAPPSPFKGLAPFGESEADALFFFGRERESEVIAANVIASRLTVLYGPSGVGKSSVLRAGAARRLRSLVPEAAVVAHGTWAGDPVESLRDAVARAEPDLAPPRAAASLADGLADWTRRRGGELYLLLDQFEEVFTYHERGGGLTAELAAVLRRRSLPVHVLLALREDALAELDVFAGLVPNVFGNALPLDRLDREAARSAIVGPIRRYNALAPESEQVAIEPELVDVVLDEVKVGRLEPAAGASASPVPGAGIEAPYLQLVLERLWAEEAALGSGILRRETLAGLGGAGAIVRAHLERAVGALEPADRELAARVFNHLVTPSGTKIAYALGDLAGYAHVPEDELRRVLGVLGEERIVRPLDGRYEIFHDVLGAAVLGWRRRFESERELRRERRRRRRAIVVATAAVAGMALMSAIAVYALAQRSEAREQTALARASGLDAKRQAEEATRQKRAAEANAEEARAQRRDAVRQRERLQAALTDLRRQRQEAVRLADVAAEQRRRAEAESARSQEARDRAERETARATDAQLRAEGASARAAAAQTVAEREGARAERAAAEATAAARRSQVNALTQRSLALLGVDAERALRSAVEAAELAADPSVAEDTLRRSLLALRLEARLDAGGGAVTRATYSGDGSLVLTASRQGGARVFDARSARLLHVLAHPDGVALSAATFDARSASVLTGGSDGIARLFDTRTGGRFRELAHGSPITAVALGADGRVALTGGVDGELRLWDAASGVLVGRHRQGGAVRGIEPSRDGRLALVFTSDRFGRVYDVETARLVATVAQPGELTAAAFGPDGSTLATAGTRNVFLWSTRTWQQLHVLQGNASAIRDVAYAADGSEVASAGIDGVLRTWRVDTGAAIATFSGHTNTTTSVDLSPDGTTIASGSNDRTGRIWSRARVGAPPIVLAGHTGAVTALSYAPDGRRVLTASKDGTARIWSAHGDPVLQALGAHDAPVESLETSADGRRVLSGGADGTARLWRAGAPPRVLRHGGTTVEASFVTGGRVLSWGADGFARLWSADGETPLVSLEHGAPVLDAAASAAGNLITTAGEDGSVRLWSASGVPLRRLPHGEPVDAIAFAPSGDRLASGARDGVARLWDASGRLLRSLRAHEGPVVALAFGPRGDRVATAGDDGTGRVWPLTGTGSAALVGHDGALTSVAFSPDGGRVLTASRDGEPILWDAVTGERVASLNGHVATVSDAIFSPDGRWIVTAGPSAVGLWKASDGAFVFFLRGEASQVRAVAFGGTDRIVAGFADGSVRSSTCAICGRADRLLVIARARLAQLDRRAAAARG